MVAIGLTALAMHIALRRNNIGGYATGAGLFAVGIVGLHFTAMTAVLYVPDPTVVVSGVVMNPEILAVAVAAVVVLIMALGLIGAVVDHHLATRATEVATRLRAHIEELETTKSELEATSANLSRALENAALANRAKSQFLATMSHELRTPLNAVIGFSDMLAREIFGPLGNPRYREYAGDICASGAHLLSLINDILDLSRLDIGQAGLEDKLIDLSTLIGEAARMVRGQAEAASLSLTHHAERNLPKVHADERRMRQVLINLLSNAIKFTPAGGRVSIRAFRRGEEIAVAVSDTGIGMSKEDLPRALEHFSQIDSELSRRYEGAGLGLPICKKLMEAHGGYLELESEPNVGTTATVILPTDRVVEPSLQVA